MAIEQNEVEKGPSPGKVVPWSRSYTSLLRYLRRSTLPRVLIAIIAGSSMSLAGLLAYLNRPHSEEEELPQGVNLKVADALAMLDAGAPLKAQRMAARLTEMDSLPAEDAGGPPFIFGVVAASDAERLWGQDQKRYFRLAARYLEESQDKGFPAGREAEGLLLLGKSLLMCGEVVKSRAALEQALEANPEPDAEIHRLLVVAYKSNPQPDFDRALLHNTSYLADPELTRSSRAEGQLYRAQILFQLKQDAECRKALAEIGPATEAGVESLLIEGELLMREAGTLFADETVAAATRMSNAKAKYRAAIDVLRRAQNRGTERERITRHSMYLIGQCLLRSDDLRAALDQFRRVRETYEDTAEGIAAALEEAEILRRMGQDKDLVQKYLNLLKTAGPSDTYYNPFLSLEALRSRLLAAYQGFLESSDFDSAAKLAAGLHPLFTREDSITLLAQARSGWAESLELQVGKNSGDVTIDLKNAARAQRRQAAAAYATLAQLHFATDRYTEDVWNSADNYLRGHDYPSVEAMLQEYLKYELRRRRPRALLDLGDAQLALGKPTLALLTLQECIDNYTRDPASYRARLVAARAQMERGSLDEAKRLLLANLEGTELTPESVEWRDSLFSLGALLHDEGQMFEAQGRRQRAEALATNLTETLNLAETNLQRAQALYEETARRLEEAVARYPDVPQVVESRYVIAESFRALGRFAREKLDHAKIETTRLEHSRELQRLLTSAVTEYEQVQEILTRRRERSQLSSLEQAILRNCYFARGAAFCELGRFDEAIAAYSAATNRYHNEPEVLDAFVQLAHCYRQLGKPDEARGVVEQAKAALTRIPTEASFKQTTIHSRQEWARVLAWLGEL